jgi:hypothetical protein
MSQIDADENILSEDIEGQDGNKNQKLVPVTESIRYRKRAQSAEKKIEDLTKELAQMKLQTGEMAKELSSVRMEQKLIRKLAAAGAIDVEAAVLIAKSKIGDGTEVDLDGMIQQLKREKQYLFSGSNAVVTVKRTAGAKDRVHNNQTILERAAKKAATTGNRTDLHEYLKLRRNFV